MYSQKPSSRQIPGIISYMDLFSTQKLAYSIFFTTPGLIALLSMILNAIFTGIWNFIYLFVTFSLFLTITGLGAILAIYYYSKKAPILGRPPKGWALQMNAFITGIMGISLLIGQILTIVLRLTTFQDALFMLGTVISYIIAYVIYFSFTTVGTYGTLILSLIQPITGIVLYGFLTAQISILFFIRAIIFFCSCAFIFAIPYARSMARVSNIYRELTGIGGYPFIRAFVLSMMTDGNDDLVEEFFDKIGVQSEVKIQYIFIRSKNKNKLKSMFIVPNVHFGPFKTCGSSDLPALIYHNFSDIPGTTVYHTTNDHSQNLTTQQEVKKIIAKIQEDVKDIEINPKVIWIAEINNLIRKMSNSAKIIGTKIGDIPIIYLTRHPLPSDDIEYEIGETIRQDAKSKGFGDVIIIDSHNSIIDDEHLIRMGSLESKDLIKVADNFFKALGNKEEVSENPVLYGVAKDPLKEFSEKDGIGPGGLVVHLFKNAINSQKTAMIHFDANNAFVDIRSYILNTLQNRGIERGEITTSDAHIVARKFTKRGYSPIGEKIKLDYILNKLDTLLAEAERNLEPVDFTYRDSIVKNVRIWGDPKYFDVIMRTLQECIRISQRLLTFSLIAPTLISLIILIFFYNVELPDIFNLF
jgi:predicted neutral ceramidase superfamily lipid hydrolase